MRCHQTSNQQLESAWSDFCRDTPVALRGPWEAFKYAYKSRMPSVETSAGPAPHGVVYDKPGWICSICGFWNNIKDNHCAGIHLESDRASVEPTPSNPAWSAAQNACDHDFVWNVLGGSYQCEKCLALSRTGTERPAVNGNGDGQ